MIDRKAPRRKPLILVWVGFAWNFIEASVSLLSASVASSVALLAFGLDSPIEILLEEH